MGVNEKAAYACGGVVVAGLVYLVMALIIRTVGIAKVMRFLPPVVTGPMIVCIGLSLAPVAVANSSVNWPLALAAILTVIVFNIWGRGMLKLIPILMGVVLLYIASVFLDMLGFTNTDGSAIINYNSIANASWIGLPPFKMQCGLSGAYASLGEDRVGQILNHGFIVSGYYLCRFHCAGRWWHCGDSCEWKGGVAYLCAFL